MAGLAVLVSWLILKGSHHFLHTFSMALYQKWGVKTGFTFALQFFMFISDGLGGVGGLNCQENFLNNEAAEFPFAAHAH